MLKCDICGAELVIQAGGVPKCSNCGVVYSQERLKEKIAASKDVTDGAGGRGIEYYDAEKERLLRNAETFRSMKDYGAAHKIFAQVSEHFPDDYRGWLGLFTEVFRAFSLLLIAKYECVRTIEQAEGYAERALSVGGHEDVVRDVYHCVYDQLAKRLDEGTLHFSLDCLDDICNYQYTLENSRFIDSYKRYYKGCVNNAVRIKHAFTNCNEIPIKTVLSVRGDGEYVNVGQSPMSDIIGFSGYDILVRSTMPKSYVLEESLTTEEVVSRLRSIKGLCPSCGGTYHFLSNVCKSCGSKR